MLQFEKKQLEEYKMQRDDFLDTIEKLKNRRTRITLSLKEIYVLQRIMNRSFALNDVLKKQFYRIFSCDEEEKIAEKLFDKLEKLHTNDDWLSFVLDVLYLNVHGEFLKIDLFLRDHKIDKEETKKIITDLKQKHESELMYS